MIAALSPLLPGLPESLIPPETIAPPAPEASPEATATPAAPAPLEPAPEEATAAAAETVAAPAPAPPEAAAPVPAVAAAPPAEEMPDAPQPAAVPPPPAPSVAAPETPGKLAKPPYPAMSPAGQWRTVDDFAFPRVLPPSLQISLGRESTVSEDNAHRALLDLENPPKDFDEEIQGTEGVTKRKVAQRQLYYYLWEQQDNNRPFFPNKTPEANRQRHTLHHDYFTKPLEEVLDGPRFRALEERARLSSNSDAFKKGIVLRTFFSDLTGKQLSPLDYERFRNIYGTQYLGLTGDTSDKAVFDAIQARYREDDQTAKTLAESNNADFLALIKGGRTDEEKWKATLAALPERHREGAAKNRSDVHYEARNVNRRIKPVVDQTMEIIRQIAAVNSQSIGIGGGRSHIIPDADDELRKRLPELMGLMPDHPGELGFYMARLLEEMNAMPEDQRGRFRRILGGVARGVENQILDAAHELARSGSKEIVKAFGAGMQATNLIPKNYDITQDYVAFSSEYEALLEKQRLLRDVIQGNALNLEKSTDGYLTAGLIKFSSSAWMIPASAAGPYGWMLIASSLGGQSLINERAQHPQADPHSLIPTDHKGPSETARFFSSLGSGVLQTAPEVLLNRLGLKFLAGRIPGLPAILTRLGITAPLARAPIGAMAGATGILTTQYIGEGSQAAIDRGVHDLSHVLSGTAPGRDKDWETFIKEWIPLTAPPEDAPAEVKENWQREQKDTLQALVPLLLIGGVGASFSHFQNGRHLAANKRLLHALGVPEARIREITTAKDVASADAALQAAFRDGLEERTAEHRAAAIQKYRALQDTAAKAGFPSIYSHRDETTGEDVHVFQAPNGTRQEFATQGEAYGAWYDHTAKVSAADFDLLSLAGKKDAISFLTGAGKKSEGTEVNESNRKVVIGDPASADVITPEQATKRIEVVAHMEQTTPEEVVSRGDLIVRARRFAQITKEGLYRGVVQFFRGSNIADVFEEFAEDGFARAMHEGYARGEDLLREVRQVEASTGLKLIRDDYVYSKTDQMPLLEGLSALSRAHAFGNLRTGMLPDSVRQWTEMNVSLFAFGLRGAQNISADLERAGTLRQAIADGQLSPEFLGLLADSIGVNQQAIEQRLAERKADGDGVAPNANTSSIFDADGNIPLSASFSISPSEAIDLRRKIESQTPMDVSTSTLPDISKPALVKQWARDNDIYGETSHPEIKGPILIAPSSIKSEIAHRLSPKKAASLAVMRQLIPQATYLESNRRNPDVLSHRMAATVNIDGHPYVARIVIDEDLNGNRLYNHELSDLKQLQETKSPRPLQSDAAHQEQRTGWQEFEDTGMLLQWIYSVNEGNVSGTTSPAADSSAVAKSHPPLNPAKLTDLIDTDSETSFSIGTDPSSGDSEARINEATVEARKKVAAADAESIKRAGRFWLSLHGEKGVARLPELRSKTMEELVKEANAVIPGLTTYPFGMIGDAHVTTIEDGVGVAFISVGSEGVWVNTSSSGGTDTYGSPGMHENRVKASMSPAVYQIAQAYAKNNGLKFIPDPAGVSTIATFRRWPQLLSSAIRIGDTSHIDGTKDVEGWKDGDHEHNAGLLALHEYEQVRHFFPEIDGLHLSEDSSTITDHAGAPVSTRTLEDLLTGDRHPSRLGIGETTLRRAIVTGQVAAEGRLEPDAEVSRRPDGERRIHSGAIEHFTPDSGSGDQGTGALKHALDGISYSIGSDSYSDSDPSNQSHPQQYDEEGRVVPGTRKSPEGQRRSEEESRRRIREALARAEKDDGEERIGHGSESHVFGFGSDEVLKEIKSEGIVRYRPDGTRAAEHSLEAAREKASVIEALGGMPTIAMAAEDKIFIIQQRGTPISETDYLSIELPFGIEPSRQGIYKIEIDGEDYLISDLRPENFVKDSQGNIRLIDLITGKVTKGSKPK